MFTMHFISDGSNEGMRWVLRPHDFRVHGIGAPYTVHGISVISQNVEWKPLICHTWEDKPKDDGAVRIRALAFKTYLHTLSSVLVRCYSRECIGGT